MLIALLDEIRKGGTLELDDLAKRLNTSPGMLKAMLEHLQQNGLIDPYVDCGDGCLGCSLKKICHKDNELRLWRSISNG